MKVIQVTPRYYPHIGGIETYVTEISERMAALGHDVEVVTTDPSGKLKKRETINGVKIIRFKTLAPHDAFYFAPQMYFYLRNQYYDIIHAHSFHAFPALFAALAKNGKRLVFNPYFHGKGHTSLRNLLHMPYRLVGYYIFKKSDRIVCISGVEQKLICDIFNIEKSMIKIIPPGLDLIKFGRIGLIERNNKTILYVGRLEEYKGIQHIIKILPYLHDFKLIVIGKGSYEPGLRKLAEDLSVTKRISWHKNITREELLHQYASADVFLMLSAHEAYGITVAEALMSGTPCIVAMGSALDEFVDGERCIGIETPIKNDKLISAIEQLRESNIKGKIKTKNLPIHDWEDVTGKLIELYRGVQ